MFVLKTAENRVAGYVTISQQSARASAAESLLRVYTRIIERLASLSIQCMMLRQEPKRLLEGELLRISIQ